MVRIEKKLVLVSGTANRKLSEEVSAMLKVPLANVKHSRFADGETYARIEDDVAGKDVFVIQPTCPPGNDNLMELLVTLEALRRASAGRITAVVPFYGYGRQDRKSLPGEPITAKLVANLISAAGADHMITCDLHTDKIHGFFDMPMQEIKAMPVLAEYFLKKNIPFLVVVAPDHGSVKRSTQFAKLINTDVVVISKRRDFTKHDALESISIFGDVMEKSVVMIDDEINTAGTIVSAAEILREHGAKDIYVACTHAVFAGPAVARLENSPIKEVVVTDTIPVPEDKLFEKLRILSLAQKFAEEIRKVHEGL